MVFDAGLVENLILVMHFSYFYHTPTLSRTDFKNVPVLIPPVIVLLRTINRHS